MFNYEIRVFPLKAADGSIYWTARFPAVDGCVGGGDTPAEAIAEANENLKVLSFPVMTDEWLDFVVACRRGIKHDYDIVEGPMADDQIWDYVEDFMEGTITREAFWVLAKFKYPTHQIVFCTQNSLESITFEKSYSL